MGSLRGQGVGLCHQLSPAWSKASGHTGRVALTEVRTAKPELVQNTFGSDRQGAARDSSSQQRGGGPRPLQGPHREGAGVSRDRNCSTWGTHAGHNRRAAAASLGWVKAWEALGWPKAQARAYFQDCLASRGPHPVLKAHSHTRSMPSSHWQRPL